MLVPYAKRHSSLELASVISARDMALFNKVFSTRRLLQIVCVLGAVVAIKLWSAHYDFSWASAVSG